jgi:hypothetical protein
VRARTPLAVVREILARPVLLAGLSIVAIILGILILLLSRLPPSEAPDSQEVLRTEVVMVRETPPLLASP